MRAVLITGNISPKYLQDKLVQLGFDVCIRTDPSAFIKEPVSDLRNVDLLIVASQFNESNFNYLCKEYNCAKGEHIQPLADLMPNALVATYKVGTVEKGASLDKDDHTGKRIITVNDVSHPTDIPPVIMPVFARYISRRIGSLGYNPRKPGLRHWISMYRTSCNL